MSGVKLYGEDRPVLAPEVEDWFTRRTTHARDWPLAEVLARKGSQRITVLLPARDEERTVGRIVERLVSQLVQRSALADEVVVVDSASTDATGPVAAAAGATVVRVDEPGKGRALWHGLQATTGDLVCFLDADLPDFTPTFVTALLGPLLADPAVQLVKATYDRSSSDGAPAGGGRVTELVARPLINLHWPLLAGFVQPLSGECAGRRSLLEQLAMPVGYGVELAQLIDTLALVGLDGLAQVDLVRRKHRHQGNVKLGQMAAAILRVAERRLGIEADVVAELVQWRRQSGGYVASVVDVTEPELPPVASLR